MEEVLEAFCDIPLNGANRPVTNEQKQYSGHYFQLRFVFFIKLILAAVWPSIDFSPTV